MTENDQLNDVAVIMINYNSSDYSISCIKSILCNTNNNLHYQIIVIDNASTGEDYKNLQNQLALLNSNNDIFLFRSRINLGFSGGNMLGVQFANAKYYFFLNNDCVLQNDCLSILHTFCESNSEVALCSPQLYLNNGNHQPCIGYFPVISTKIIGVGILKLFYGKRYYKRKILHKKPVQVDVISGSQMFVNSERFDAIGGLDTTFFLYCEEEDIALRLFKAGHKTYLVPEAKNIHIGGGSTNNSLEIKKEFYISFLYFYRKHFGQVKTQTLKIILILRLLKKSIKDISNLKLALFIFGGAHLKHSLRHRQPIVDNI